ncbi:hypothetical protein EHW99_2741 [Erwinia amylovora]|uniref:Uncharacterized protein n=1 Tax=Erwinia amylovora (strain CFBP1430) TaxID=665029 RepID=D4HX98_ERWAC|nr:hypothetical protein EaACW_0848 [Erwinia amylovora ACW56400]QJQ55442.1 hypothetical protein EHX00_2741 [Erwinia amylovora]CBA19789.1 hypothetical protein predicted by Glimmer/Critica [Erwinia amylovora CFBP1430]QJQ59141.1 hypothetical protein EHW99_2741 [Erwinia amylovora]QJQ62840.1 hypothetical protein EHW98_2741 [Erwinia amylovora]
MHAFSVKKPGKPGFFYGLMASMKKVSVLKLPSGCKA